MKAGTGDAKDATDFLEKSNARFTNLGDRLASWSICRLLALGISASWSLLSACCLEPARINPPRPRRSIPLFPNNRSDYWQLLPSRLMLDLEWLPWRMA